MINNIFLLLHITHIVYAYILRLYYGMYGYTCMLSYISHLKTTLFVLDSRMFAMNLRTKNVYVHGNIDDTDFIILLFGVHRQ